MEKSFIIIPIEILKYDNCYWWFYGKILHITKYYK